MLLQFFADTSRMKLKRVDVIPTLRTFLQRLEQGYRQMGYRQKRENADNRPFLFFTVTLLIVTLLRSLISLAFQLQIVDTCAVKTPSFVGRLRALL